MREFAFELALCAHLEGNRLVGRQLGGGVHSGRVLDVVLVEPGPAFDERTAITEETIPAAAIESDVGPGRARKPGSAFDCHPERVDAAVERAVEIGFFQRERRGGRRLVRATTRYPADWFDRIVGVENKPDLGRPGDLQRQLRTDVSLGLCDAVVLATASHVTGAHRNRIPDEVGIWQFDPDERDLTVHREPEPLATARPGVEPVDARPGRTDVRIVSPEEKHRRRRRLAERVYGKGWRTYDLPDCARIDPDGDGLPGCPWHGRLVRPAVECGPDCSGHEPADPPDFDRTGLRAARTPWEADPAGRTSRQTGLDSYE